MKYTKNNVKRQHTILDGTLPILEQIGKIDGIKRVIPAKINYSPKRKIKNEIKIQRKTISGLKLLVHNNGGIQEIFLVIDHNKIQQVEKQINFFLN